MASTLEEEVAKIKQVIANSKLKLADGIPVNGDFITYFNDTSKRYEHVEISVFLGLVASAGITFEPNGDNIDIKLNGATQVSVSKVGQDNLYASLTGKPDLTQYQLKNEKGIPFGYTPSDGNNKVPLIHIPELPYVPDGGYTGTGQDLQDQINGLDQAVILQNTPFDASSGVFPGGGTAQAGYKYLVSVSGTVDGVKFVNGDSVTAIIDNASTTTYAGNWQKINNAESVQNFQQVTDQGATTTNEVESTNSFKSPQFKISNSGFEAILSAILTASRNISFQDKDGIVATLDDVTAAAILNKLLTVDSDTSGLNSNFLQGLLSSQFLRSDADDVATGLISINRSGENVELFRFNTERPWSFKQGLSGSFTALDLEPDISNKNFRITDPVSGASISMNSLTGRITTIGASGYTTALTLTSLGDNDWITKKQFNDNGVVASEGTFTPTITDGGGGATYSSTIITGKYYKIGKKVFIRVNIQGINTTGTPSGQLRIGGLPFTPDDEYSIGVSAITNIGTNFGMITARTSSLVNYLLFEHNFSVDDTLFTLSSTTINSGEIQLSGEYLTT